MTDENLETLQEQIRELRGKLNLVNQKKEASFAKHKQSKNSLLDKIHQAKQIQSETKDQNNNSSKLKQKRDAYNAKVRKLIQEIKLLNTKKYDLFKKLNIRGDVTKLKEQVDQLQLKLQTEALSIEAEKRLMKQIKSIQKIYSDDGEVKQLLDNIDNISKEIDEAKIKADEYHQQLVKASKGRQYNELIDVSKEIHTLRADEKEHFNEFKKHKGSFLDINEVLQKKLREAASLKGIIEQKSVKEKTKQSLEQAKKIDKKAKVAEEKLKKGGKLTTEDLLAMQGSDIA
ncbi:hypothetical protein CL622_03850 [archaeon]|nr:hypothetical protein [archaeon]|tara:strand:- start:71 stop:931 length:861 start_codon:yes stop_codon:yes gene_type:complete